MASDDPFAAFGSDDNDDDDTDESSCGSNCKNGHSTAVSPAHHRVAAFLAQRLLTWDPTLSLSNRRILLLLFWRRSNEDTSRTKEEAAEKAVLLWKAALAEKQMTKVEVVSIAIDSEDHQSNLSITLRDFYDAVIVIACPSSIPSSNDPTTSNNNNNNSNTMKMMEPTCLLPGGVFIFHVSLYNMIIKNGAATQSDFWDTDTNNSNSNSNNEPQKICESEWFALNRKGPIGIAEESCPWLSRTAKDKKREWDLVEQATTALSAHERLTGDLTPHSIRRAVQSLRQNGYCIVAGLLQSETERCLEFGRAVLQDLHAAAQILLQRDQINLHQPTESQSEPKAYRELSMREDCRMDLRHGPALQRLRSRDTPHGNRPVTITPDDAQLPGDFLRGNASVLEIARRAMNPSDPALAPGNFGRYNFDGRGPDGSYQDLHAGVVGGIVSLPGAADQAVHADTPHLFECNLGGGGEPLPPHYINVLTAGCAAAAASPQVGPTALIHGSHRLDAVAQYVIAPTTTEHNFDNDDTLSLHPFHSSMWRQLVRPVLNVGDVLLFDCRILHFGLANTHATVERPLLYTNLTQHWFHDPKNWSERESIFGNDTTSHITDDTAKGPANPGEKRQQGPGIDEGK